MDWKRWGLIALVAPLAGYGLGRATDYVVGMEQRAMAQTADTQEARPAPPPSEELEIIDLGQFVVPVPGRDREAYLLVECRIGFDEKTSASRLVALRPSLRHAVLEELFDVTHEGWLEQRPIDLDALSDRLRRGVAAELPEGPVPLRIFFDRLMVQERSGS